MRIKQLIILGIIFVLLLGTIFAKKIFIKQKTEITEYRSLEISFDPASISRLEIKRAQKEDSVINLEKKDDLWLIPDRWNIKADQQRIENVIKELSSLKGELRSSSEEILEDYGISDDQAFSIILFDKAAEVQKFLIGTKGDRFGNSFLRKGGSAEVYLVQANILTLIDTYKGPEDIAIDLNLDDWIDLSLLKFDVERIGSIRIVKSEETKKIPTVDIKREFDAERKLKHWVIVGNKPPFDIDAKKIRIFLKRLSNMYANKVVDPQGADYGFDKPFFTLTLNAEDQKMQLLVSDIADEKSAERYVQTSLGYTYVISKYTFNNIDIDISKFFIDNPLRIDRDKLQSVNIKTDKESIALDKDLIEKNATYIKKLKEISIEKMLFDEEYAQGLKMPTAYLLEIKNEDGSSLIMDVEKESLFAQVRGREGVFKINNTSFKNIFEELDKLNFS